jgi:hypothetical protein
LATKFMPSCRLETRHRSAARKSVEDLLGLVVPGDQDDGPPAGPTETPIDRLGHRLGLCLGLAIGWQAAARRGGDLQETETADPLRMVLDQTLHRAEPVGDALGVVEALDAHGKQRIGVQLIVTAHHRSAIGHGRLAGQRGGRPLDRDRVGSHQGYPAAGTCGALLPIDAALQETVHGIQEIQAVELGVEPQDRAAEQSFQDLLAPGADAEDLGVGPGDVPEGDDGGAGQALPDHLGQQGEVIVLDQDQRIGDCASATTASANLRFTATYCSQSEARKVGRTKTM